MNHPLDNPVFNSLKTGNLHLGTGTVKVKYFDEEVSPFASFETGYANGFTDLHQLLPAKRVILYASPQHIDPPEQWRLLDKIEGVQMLHETKTNIAETKIKFTPLTKSNVEEMLALATLTKPGPFAKRTIEFGNYFGIFENEKLVAMTGQRMHIDNYVEVSAVCTHPDALGKGYATAMIQHQLKLIAAAGKQAFLHVRADNDRAIKIYERLGFSIRTPMNFYILKK